MFKKLNRFLSKKFSTLTVKMNERPVFMTVIILLAINLLYLLIAAGAAMLIESSRFKTYFHSLATVFQWLVIPTAVFAENNPGGDISMFTLALITFVIGLVLFTGTIIAIVTTYLRGYITQRGEARGKLTLGNHIVILNYNNEVTAILADLMHSGATDTVIILSDKTRDFVMSELKAEISMLKDKPNAKLKLIGRKRNPHTFAEQQHICIKCARDILITDDARDAGENVSDLATGDYGILKLVLKLSNADIDSGCPIGVEADSFETAKMVRQLKKTVPGLRNKSIMAFSHNRKLGQFLALSILCPALSGVLSDLLAFTGCMFYPIDKIPTDEYLSKYSGGIPIISLDKTYVLAEEKQDCFKKRNEEFCCERRLPPAKEKKKKKTIKLYLIGENKKSEYMLEELKHENAPVEIHKYGTYETKRFAEDLARHGDEDSVALILSDGGAKEEDYDSNVFLTLIELSSVTDLGARKFQIIAELLEPDNQKSLEEFNIQNIIVSTRIISFFATKLLLDPKAEQFYEEIFSTTQNGTEKMDLWIDDAKYLFDLEGGASFSSYAEFVNAAYYGADKKRMPIGLIRDEKETYFCIDMDKEREFVLSPDDKIIYIEYL